MMTNLASNNLLISFIIPCFNAYDSIMEAVDSINKQKSKLINDNQVEVIIVDDASDDNGQTIEKCKALVKKYNNVKLITLSNNLGQAEARNNGISQARGKYIGFIDADDIASQNLLPTLEKYINKDYDVLLWGLYEEHYNNKKQMVKQIEVTPAQAVINKQKEILLQTVALEEKTLLGYLWNKLYKRDIFKNNNIKLPNEHLVEDELFNIEFFKHIDTLFCINKPLYHYKRINTNGDTVTSSYLEDYFSQYSKRIQCLYDLWKNENILSTNAKKVLGNEYTRFTMSAIWRNSQKESKMSKRQQVEWINEWYKNDLTKKLLQHSKPNGFIAKKYTSYLKNKQITKILFTAKLINFTSRYMSKTLIRARQSR